jgi:hypothetical protein
MTDMKFASKSAILAMAAFALVTTQAHAGLTLFTGADDGAGSLATAPNSVAAAASFDAAAAALAIENLITFESSPLGLFSSLAPAPGVTLTGTNVNGNNQSIVNTTSNINITPPCSKPRVVTTQPREDRIFCFCSGELQRFPLAAERMRLVPI